MLQTQNTNKLTKLEWSVLISEHPHHLMSCEIRVACQRQQEQQHGTGTETGTGTGTGTWTVGFASRKQTSEFL